jgi:hypothetical protein
MRPNAMRTQSRSKMERGREKEQDKDPDLSKRSRTVFACMLFAAYPGDDIMKLFYN